MAGFALSTEVYYLHGPLHVFDARIEVQKYTWVNTASGSSSRCARH